MRPWTALPVLLSVLVGAVLSVALPTPGVAQSGMASSASMALDGHLLVESVEGPSGGTARRTLRNPAEVRSGDRLIFLIRYRNRSDAPLTGYDFVAPIPRGVRILPDRTDSVRVSIDGGRNWSRPDSPVRIDAQGHLHGADGMKPTHVRLRLDRRIAAGEAGTVAYRGLLL